MSIPKCERCCAKHVSNTIESSSYEYTSAPPAVIVPSLTANGYFVAS